jgi:LuxR family transcriptional regulator, maltose regulon positive regulatory protein
VISRDVLPSVLERMQGKRLTIARAPAGYGKSLLLGQMHDQLLASGEAVGWISTAELDGSARELALYIVATLRPTFESNEPSEIEWLFSRLEETDLQGIAAAVRNAVQRAGRRFTLFLDDLHVLSGTAAMRLVASIVRDVPEGVSFAVATRVQPSFNLARLRAHGHLLELSADELRFSASEATRFLLAGREHALTPELAELAFQRTEGWPAGLQLIALSAQSGQRLTDQLQRFSGADRNVREYLEQDVLAALTAPMQTFLSHTSVLREFTADLCDELLDRRDSREFIAELERAGLFIFSLDTTGDWFRYHHLFREFLAKQLEDRDPQGEVRLHAKAARCFRSRGLASEALYHSCAAGDLAHAAAVLDDACEESFYQGRLWSLAGWIRRVPESLLDAYPRMQLARVWSLTLELKFNEAHDILQRVTARIDAAVANKSISAQQARQLDRIVLHRRMMLAQFRDDLPETERLCNKLLIDFPNDEEPFLRGSLDASLANAHQVLYKLDSLDRLDKSAREYFGRTGMSYPLVFHESIIGSACLQRGSIEQAAHCYQSAIDIATSIAGQQSSLVAMPALLMGQMRLERCEFVAARAAFDQYLPLAGGVGFVDQLIAGFVGRARLADLEDDFSLAQELLTKGDAAATAGSFDRLHWHVVAERARQAIRRHDITGAKRVATRSGLSRDPLVFRPHDGMTSQHEAMALTWMRLNAVQSPARPFDDLVRRWIEFASRRSCLRCELRMRLVCAAGKFAQGEANAATRMLAEAVAKAGPSGFALMFVEEGDLLRAALARMLNTEDESTPAKSLATSLAVRLSRFAEPAQVSGGVNEQPFVRTAASGELATLTQREIDIISRVANGALNREVGAQLGLTEGTVKWYLQQIYRKLGTRRRVDAVRLARSIGLVR